MKLRIFSLLVSGVVSTASAQTLTVDFASLGSSLLSFGGTDRTLTFLPDPATGYDFRITSSSIPGLAGLDGIITGTVTVGPVTIAPDGLASAALTGTTGFEIFDGSSADLTGDISWGSLTTYSNDGLFQRTGATLGDLSYSGGNAALQALVGAAGSGAVDEDVVFLLPTAKLIEPITSDSDAFSGSLTAIPEPRTWAALAGVSAFALAVFSRRGQRKGSRRNLSNLQQI